MTILKEQMLLLTCQKAPTMAADLADEYAWADVGEKEAILAGLEFERWLADCCDELLG